MDVFDIQQEAVLTFNTENIVWILSVGLLSMGKNMGLYGNKHVASISCNLFKPVISDMIYIF